MQATAEWLETDFYEVLGVAPDATSKQIKSAYRKLARTAHPDANPDDPTAEQRFSDIAKAYEVLRDDDSRAEYDEFRSRPRHSGQRHFDEADFAGFSGFGRHDFGHGGFESASFDISDLFGREWPMRGADVAARLEIDFESAVNGTTTSFEIDGRTVTTRIPAGVNDGQTIRLAGKGGAGRDGGPAGDLLIEISVAPHPVFTRRGRHLEVTVPVSYCDAVLGGEMHVPTLDGETVTVRIPAGTPVGRTFRIAGRGVPAGGSHAQAGDLLASVTIAVPTEVSPDDADLLRRLSA